MKDIKQNIASMHTQNFNELSQYNRNEGINEYPQKFAFIRKHKRIRKIKASKQDCYGAPFAPNAIQYARNKIRSLPRHMSRRKNLRAQVNKSMVNNKEFVESRGVILAMSRRTKLKSMSSLWLYNYIGSNRSKEFKAILQTDGERLVSRRSNSVSTHRRSHSTHRSRSKRRTDHQFYSSKTNLKGRKYIKNVLPIVTSNEGELRNRIANGFDSNGHRDL